MNLKKIFTKENFTNKRILIILGIVIVFLGGGFTWLFLSGNIPMGKSENTDTAPSYQTSVVRQGDLTISATGTGTLVAGKSVDLSFSTEGIVEELYVKAGDKVTKGTKLAKMNNAKTLEAQVASNELALLNAKKSLSDLQNNKDVNLAQSYQDVLTTQSAYDDALRNSQKSDYARCSKEVNKNNLAALEKAQDRLDQIGLRYYGSETWTEARNVYDTALANYNYCIKYTDDEKVDYQAALDIADVNLKKAKSNYEILKSSAGINPDDLALAEAKVQEAQVKLDISKENLTGSTLTAPIDGSITYLKSNAGAYVDTTTYITISDLSTSDVDVSIDEADLDKLFVGAKATIVFDALEDEIYTGEVTQVNPELSKSGQYNIATAVISVDSLAGRNLEKLPLGVNGTVTIIAHEAKNALLVSANAVRSLGNGQSGVFKIQSDGTLLFKIVEVGLVDTTRAEIVSGLTANDIVSTGLASGSN